MAVRAQHQTTAPDAGCGRCPRLLHTTGDLQRTARANKRGTTTHSRAAPIQGLHLAVGLARCTRCGRSGRSCRNSVQPSVLHEIRHRFLGALAIDLLFLGSIDTSDTYLDLPIGTGRTTARFDSVAIGDGDDEAAQKRSRHTESVENGKARILADFWPNASC